MTQEQAIGGLLVLVFLQCYFNYQIATECRHLKDHINSIWETLTHVEYKKDLP